MDDKTIYSQTIKFSEDGVTSGPAVSYTGGVTVFVDGNDGTGKTTLVEHLNKLSDKYTFKERGVLTKLSDTFPERWPTPLEYLEPNTYNFIVDASTTKCIERIEARGGPKDVYDTPQSIFKYKRRFTRLAIKYDVPVIDTTNVLYIEMVDVAKEILKYVEEAEAIETPWKKDFKYISHFPNPDLITDEQFEAFPTLAEGHSKIVKAYSEKYTLLKAKPMVHSHKQQRAGVVEGTDVERLRMTQDILYILDQECIPHAYIYVGHKYILCHRLKLPEYDEDGKMTKYGDIPPVEVIVKKCCLGTDKHRYFEADKQLTRFGTPLVGDRREYPDLVVRFDYRNPNHHPETGKPLGDEAMSDDMASFFMDVPKTKTLVKKTFRALDKHFANMGVYFEDVCFMVTTDGSMHFYEISQDCGRYKKVTEDGMTDLDKDVWRAGGSSDLVLDKWRQMTELVHNYTSTALFEY